MKCNSTLNINLLHIVTSYINNMYFCIRLFLFCVVFLKLFKESTVHFNTYNTSAGKPQTIYQKV